MIATTVKQISFSDTIINGIKYSMKIFKDPAGKKRALFTSEEPGKEIDEVFMTEAQAKAFKMLLSTKA